MRAIEKKRIFDWAAPLLCLLWLGVEGWRFGQWYSEPSDLAWGTKHAVQDITHLALWIAAWACFTHVTQGQTRLALHTCIALIASLADSILINLAIPWAFFLMGWPWPQAMQPTLWAGLIVLTALAHLRAAVPTLDRRGMTLWLGVSALTFTLTGLNTWADLNDAEAAKSLPYEANVYPLGWVKAAPTMQDGLDAVWASPEWQTLRADAPK